MTSNEQRAHDLAIASIPIIYEDYKSQITNKKQANTDSNKDFVFDLYAEYLKVYDLALKSFNRDFPDNL